MGDKTTQNIGKDSKDNVQITGNNNNFFNIQGYQRPIVKTKLFQLLKIVQNSNIYYNSEFSLELPSEMFEKLSFNNAPVYSEIFVEYVEDYYELDVVIKNEFENSERIIKRIRGLFLKQVIKIPDNGDKQLDEIRKEIKELIFCDPNFVGSDIEEEEVDQFAIALLQYGVAECKVLRPIPAVSR